jgi:hypothetical protein
VDQNPWQARTEESSTKRILIVGDRTGLGCGEPSGYIILELLVSELRKNKHRNKVRK